MALSVSSLANRISTNIQTTFETPSNPQLEKYALAMANAIIDEITQNARVSSNIPLTATGTGTVSGSTVTVDSTGNTVAEGFIS